MKKKILTILLCGTMIISAGCGGGAVNNKSKSEATTEKTHKETEIKVSPDKYTYYVKDYVGKNLASVGYTAFGGFRADEYGQGYVKFVLENKDGKYIDAEDENELKKYMVVAQDVEPNTEIKFTYSKDENGKEDDNLVKTQTVEEILLYVDKIGLTHDKVSMTNIKPASDETTYYIRDYVGRNLYDCGFTSLAEDRRDSYGKASIKLTPNSGDGSYIDVKDKESLKNYVVTKQSIEPNTKLTFDIGDYDVAKNQNIEEIELSVAAIEK